MQYPLVLATLVLAICLFVAFYVVSKLLYRHRHETKYHFYQMFPYEFNYPGVFKENLYGNILLILGCLCVIAFYEVSPYSSIYSIVGLALSIVGTMVIILLLLLPLRYLKSHMALAAVIMTLGAAIPLFNFFEAFELMKVATSDTQKVMSIVSMVYSGLLALTMMALIINPKLTFKIYYDKTTDEEGNEKLVRPKIIFMALNEWWAIFIFFLAPLAIFLLTLVY